jgi:transcriptional regulator with XRE-family HTH domain
MPGSRLRTIIASDRRLRLAAQRLGADLRTVRIGLGWSQATVARRAGVSQPTVSRLEAGDPRPSVVIVSHVAMALGLDLPLRAYPGSGIRLRDSGQLALAETVRRRAHSAWRIALEAPTSDDGKQAADLVLFGRGHAIHIELESRLVVVQAQLRSAGLKRDSLQQRHDIPVGLVIGLGDTHHNRGAVHAHRRLLGAALPATPREVWHAIETGMRIERDGLLWLRR